MHLPLANLSGITVAGVPGTGKTSLQRWWLCQLAPHPAVQIAVLDGKVSDPADGDYGPLLARCFAAAGDDLADANQLLGRALAGHAGPLGVAAGQPGHRPVLGAGPTVDCPLVLVIVDESHTYVTGASRKDRETLRVEHLVPDQTGQGRPLPGFLTVFVTQKQTADAIPTAIRDVCQVGLSVRGTDHGRRRRRPGRRDPPVPRGRPDHC